MTINQFKVNMEKLKKFKKLKKGWDQYSARPFSRRALRTTQAILEMAIIQPEIFPTSTGSIQLAWEKDPSDDFLEVMVSKNGKIYYNIFSSKAEEEPVTDKAIKIKDINHLVYSVGVKK